MPSPLARLTARIRITIAQRIRIAYALFLLPLLYLAATLSTEVLRDIRLIERELAGSRYVGALRALQDEAQVRRLQGRPHDAVVLGQALARIEAELGADLGLAPTVREALASLAALTPLPEEEARRIVRELIAAAVDRSGLSLDASLDTYYLIEALLVRLPDLVDRLGRAAQLARGASERAVGNGVREALDRERITIAGLVGGVDRALDAAATANAAAEGRRLVVLSHLDRLNEVRMLDGVLAGAGQRPLAGADIERALLPALDAIVRLRDAGGGALAHLLARRIDDGWRTLYRHVAVTALLFGLGALFLFVAVERNTLRPIRAITALMRRLASGDIGDPVTVPPRRDEIGAMFEALAVLKTHAASRVEQERALRERQDALVRITQDHLIARTPLGATLDTITRVACTTLGADRTAIVTEPLAGAPMVLSRWDSAVGRHTLDAGPARLESAEVFMRLAASITQLDTKLVLAIDDVASDPALTAEGRSWLAARGVRSGIVARISIPGRPPGYMSIAAVRSNRRWTEQDVAFARALADLAGFAFLDHGHRQALAALDLVDEGLHVADPAGEIVYANRMSRHLAGADDVAGVPAAQLPMLVPVAGDAEGVCSWRDRDGAALDLELVCRTMPDHNVVTVVRDVTLRRRQERERQSLELELRQAAKMEAIGRLAGGVAHDFNNALGTMIGYIGFLLEDLPADSQNHEHAQRLMKAADHAKEIVRQILTYSRGETTERRVGDLRALLADLQPLIRASLPASTAIALDLMPGSAPVLMNASEMHQIVLNLCINANDALDDASGRIAIELAPASPPPAGTFADDGAARITGGRPADGRDYVRLRVSDDGAGMDQETLSRIFEPFFTTKERGRGTGLGLAVVHGIIAAHGGVYVVESRRGGGTRFDIYLPLDPRGVAPAAVPREGSATRGGETVLVVDDDGDLLEVMSVGLERLGYAVVGTQDPADALESLTADPALWDAVVTDQVMPGMKGLDLLAAIKRIRPDCPVILCTGFSSDMTEAKARAQGADGFFIKPVEPAAIARRIRALLDR